MYVAFLSFLTIGTWEPLLRPLLPWILLPGYLQPSGQTDQNQILALRRSLRYNSDIHPSERRLWFSYYFWWVVLSHIFGWQSLVVSPLLLCFFGVFFVCLRNFARDKKRKKSTKHFFDDNSFGVWTSSKWVCFEGSDVMLSFVSFLGCVERGVFWKVDEGGKGRWRE